MTKTQQAYQALQTMLTHFLPAAQRMTLLTQLEGEEGEGVADTVNGLVQTIANMPASYQTEGSDEAIVHAHLHYFKGGVDAWITEKDKGNPERGDVSQHQAFGLITLSGDVDQAEMGYISIEELIGLGVELDLHWTPTTLKEIRGG